MSRKSDFVDHRAFVRAAAAYPIAAHLEGRGIDPEAVFKRKGMSVGSVRDPYAHVPLSDFTQLLEHAAELSNTPELGLKIGYEIDYANWGAFGFVIMNAPTVWTTLTSIQDLIAPWQSATHVHVERSDGLARFDYQIIDRDVTLRAQDAELSISSLINFIRRMTRGNVLPVDASFRHQPIPSREKYERYVGLWPSFEEDMNSVWYDEKDLDVENVSADVRLYTVVRTHLEDQMLNMDSSEDLVELAATHLRARLAGKPPSLPVLAAALNMHERSLQRALAASGETYSSLLRSVRISESKRLLTATSYSVKTVARLVGFSDISTFVRAFRGWSNLTPNQYRRAAHTPATQSNSIGSHA